MVLRCLSLNLEALDDPNFVASFTAELKATIGQAPLSFDVQERRMREADKAKSTVKNAIKHIKKNGPSLGWQSPHEPEFEDQEEETPFAFGGDFRSTSRDKIEAIRAERMEAVGRTISGAMVDLVAYAYAVRTKDDDTLERLCSRYNTTRALLLASLIEAGGGKTHNAISSLIGELEKIDSSETPLITWMVVPTHAIADEIAEKLSGQIAKDGLSGSIHVQQWKGRSAVSDSQPSDDQIKERIGEDGDMPSGFDAEGDTRNCLFTRAPKHLGRWNCRPSRRGVTGAFCGISAVL